VAKGSICFICATQLCKTYFSDKCKYKKQFAKKLSLVLNIHLKEYIIFLLKSSSVVWLVCFGAAGQAPSYISMSDWTDGDPAQCQSFLGPVERSRPKRRNSFAQKPHPSPPKTITTSLTACVLPCNLLWHGHTDNESQKEPTLSTKIRQKIGILRTKVQGFKINV